MDYNEALAYLEGLAVFGMKPGLSRISRLSELLGRPEREFSAVHITGTNGKGSTALMTAEALSASGLATGLYTSPHLVSYNERMRLDGADISEDDFARTLGEVKKAAEKMAAEGEELPTQFEVLTAQAFLFFAERGADYAVIEAGLGGLLDSTNIILPEVSAITNVTFEHADKCGGTLAGIARHKAGIIKPGVPVVTCATGEPLDIIRRTAAEKDAPLYALGEDFSIKRKCEGKLQTVSLSAPALGIDTRYTLSLLGAHQAENSATAVMLLSLLAKKEPRLSAKAALASLGRAAWAGRFECADADGVRVVIDGAHNPAGAETLRRALDEYFPEGERIFLLGILRDKDIDAILAALLRPGDKVVTTTPASERAEDAASLAARASAFARAAVSEPDPRRALDLALAEAGEGRLLCCAGSLYLIGLLRPMILSRQVSR